jgi:cytochrome c-type biogenesis protein CcmH/NrfG
MKKQEKVEVQYVKLNTALTIALVCLVVGIMGEKVCDAYKSGAGSLAGQPPPASPARSAPSMTPQQSQRILALEKEVAAVPDNSNAWQELGNLYFDSGNYQGAIRSYRKYLELDPDNADVLTDLGVMYRRNGQPDQAVASFDRAIAVDPQHQQSRYNKGVVLMQDLGQADTAVDVWRELLTINPEFRAPSGQRLSDMLAAMRKENSPLT